MTSGLPTRARRLCMAPTCKRPAPVGSRICGRCWGHVPAETRMTIREHVELLNSPGVRQAGYRDFVWWSYERVVMLAAWQADLRRRLTREGQDPELYAFWSCNDRGHLILRRQDGSAFRNGEGP